MGKIEFPFFPESNRKKITNYQLAFQVVPELKSVEDSFKVCVLTILEYYKDYIKTKYGIEVPELSFANPRKYKSVSFDEIRNEYILQPVILEVSCVSDKDSNGNPEINWMLKTTECTEYAEKIPDRVFTEVVLAISLSDGYISGVVVQSENLPLDSEKKVKSYVPGAFLALLNAPHVRDITSSTPIFDGTLDVDEYDIDRFLETVKDPCRCMPFLLISYKAKANPLLVDQEGKILQYCEACGRFYDRTECLYGKVAIFTLEANPELFEKKLGQKIKTPGIVIFEPSTCGGGITTISLDAEERKLNEAIDFLDSYMIDHQTLSVYPLQTVFSYQSQLDRVQKLEDKIDKLEGRQAAKAPEQAENSEDKSDEISALQRLLRKEQLRNSKLHRHSEALQERLAAAETLPEKETAGSDEEVGMLKAELASKQREIDRLNSRLKRPRDIKGIEAWADEELQGRLVMTKRALSELLSAGSDVIPSVELLIDCLEYLGNEYLDYRLGRISGQELYDLSSEFYGRHFDVRKQGGETLKAYPEQYSVLHDGHRIALDYHLVSGNKARNLIRIYFGIADNEIIIGSLPRHLQTVNSLY